MSANALNHLEYRAVTAVTTAPPASRLTAQVRKQAQSISVVLISITKRHTSTFCSCNTHTFTPSSGCTCDANRRNKATITLRSLCATLHHIQRLSPYAGVYQPSISPACRAEKPMHFQVKSRTAFACFFYLLIRQLFFFFLPHRSM